MNKLSSIFAPFIKTYINDKKLQGFGTERYRSYLSEFDRFWVDIAKKDLYIKSEELKDWVNTRINDKQSTLYARICVISNFCRYMSNLGYECYVPKRPKISFNNRHSTIFTHRQMQIIFTECDNLIARKRSPKSIVIIIPVLIRLLYSTGIRINEALAIKNSDLDFSKKTLIINDTKNNRQRIAPINNSLELVLKQYIAYRNKISVPNITHPDSYFFISVLGKPCSHITVYRYFDRILEICRLQRNENINIASLHSLRHTAAVHSLVKLTRSGKDLYCSLPLLSVFMGHKSILGTEYYVKLTQEMYPELLKIDMEVTDQIFTHINSKLKESHENESD